MRKGKNGSCMHEVQCPAKYAVTVHAARPPACLPGIAMIHHHSLGQDHPFLWLSLYVHLIRIIPGRRCWICTENS